MACIPSNGNRGREDTVCAHFGSAPFFTLYDSENGEISVLENRNSQHGHGTCHAMNQLAHYQIDAVACRGMGRRAIEALSVEGVRVVDAGSDSIDEVIQRIDRNELVDMDAEAACRNHGQHQEAKVELNDGALRRGTGRGQGILGGGGRGIGRGGGMGGGRGRRGGGRR